MACDPFRHPVRNAARSDALQIRDLSLQEIPDQRRVISCRASSGMTGDALFDSTRRLS